MLKVVSYLILLYVFMIFLRCQNLQSQAYMLVNHVSKSSRIYISNNQQSDVIKTPRRFKRLKIATSNSDDKYQVSSIHDCTFILQFDGGSRGNPGIAGAGAVLFKRQRNKKYREVWNNTLYLGNHQTNNYAEYQGLILGLSYCLESKIKSLAIQGDSLLVIKQLKGEYNVKSNNIVKLYTKAKDLLSSMEGGIFLEHIPRKRNSRADYLSNVAMDRASDDDLNSLPISSHIDDAIASKDLDPSNFKRNVVLLLRFQKSKVIWIGLTHSNDSGTQTIRFPHIADAIDQEARHYDESKQKETDIESTLSSTSVTAITQSQPDITANVMELLHLKSDESSSTMKSYFSISTESSLRKIITCNVKIKMTLHDYLHSSLFPIKPSVSYEIEKNPSIMDEVDQMLMETETEGESLTVQSSDNLTERVRHIKEYQIGSTKYIPVHQLESYIAWKSSSGIHIDDVLEAWVAGYSLNSK